MAWRCLQSIAGPPAAAAEMGNCFLPQGHFAWCAGSPLGGGLSPKGHVGMSRGTDLLPRLAGGGAAGTSRAEARGAAAEPCWAGTASPAGIPALCSGRGGFSSRGPMAVSQLESSGAKRPLRPPPRPSFCGPATSALSPPYRWHGGRTAGRGAGWRRACWSRSRARRASRALCQG